MSESPAQPAIDHGDLSGRTLGDYRLLRRLGRGAMAEVYLAEQMSLKRQVAVKILRREHAKDDTYVQRFRLEAQAAAALVHPGIVQIYEVGLVEGIHYIAQEYVQGQNLQQWLARQGPLELSVAVSIMGQVAAALSRAAERGIVHRDIKPENIMLGRDGAVKVADFGLARLTDAGAAPQLTQIGMTMGTPLYMSPEQVEGRPLDSRSDLYSFGVTSYRMLSGRLPFEGETALSVAVQHLRNEPPPLAEQRPDLPEALCRIVHRLLEKEPNQRFGSPAELLQALRELRVPDRDHGWADAEDPPGWNVGPETRQAIAEATGQLAAAMRPAAARSRLVTWTRAAAVASIVLAALAGGALGLRQREPYLLASADPERTAIARQNSALDQYLLASEINTEAAWLSVPQYFPERTYYIRLAQQQLARVYLANSDYERALAIFEEMAAMEETEADFRAFGLAGKCIILTLQRKYAESAQILSQLMPLRDRLDPQTSQMLQYAVEKNHAALSPSDREAWQELFEAQAEAADQ